MSVEYGGGSTRDQGIADALRYNGQHAFAHLYQTIATPLYGYCVDVLDDAVTACDVVQDSLVAVDARITALPAPGRLRVSVYAEARRGCQRKQSGSAAAPPAPGQAPGPEQPPGPDDVDLALRGDGAPAADGGTRSLVTAALARLPDRDREALNLAFRHDITGSDLAEVLGISPYRARSLLHAASVRFGQAAAVAAVLHAGPAGCRTLSGLVGPGHPRAVRPTARQGERLGRHLDKCADCALVLAGRSFGPELIGKIPLELPVGRLGLRITRTALALGSYRVKVAELPEVAEPPDQPGGPAGGSPLANGGGPPARGGGGRRVLKAVAASSAAIAVLAVLGVVLQHVLTDSPRPTAVKAVSGVQPSPAADPVASAAPGAAAPGQGRAGSQHRLPAVSLVGPTPFGVLPTGSTSPSGSSPAPSHTSPAPGKSTSPSPKRSPTPTPPDTTTPAPTTPPPTTPPPTTPPPTPTPSSTTIG
jgi:DNA-directed RNA polymerase specialized sigma24 family protein